MTEEDANRLKELTDQIDDQHLRGQIVDLVLENEFERHAAEQRADLANQRADLLTEQLQVYRDSLAQFQTNAQLGTAIMMQDIDAITKQEP